MPLLNYKCNDTERRRAETITAVPGTNVQRVIPAYLFSMATATSRATFIMVWKEF